MFQESGKVNIAAFHHVMRAGNVMPGKMMKWGESSYDRLFFVVGEGAVQRFSDHEWKLEDGDLVYIPRSCAYTDIGPTVPDSYSIVAMLASDLGEKCFRIPFGGNTAMGGMWQRLLDEFERKRSGWYCSCMQLLYAILGTAFKKLQSEYGGSSAAKKLRPAVEYLNSSFRDPDADVSVAASKCEVSYSRFRKLFRDVYGISAKAYLVRLRIDNACGLLAESTLPVAAVAAMCGFRDEYYFSAAFKKLTGKSPTKFRAQRDSVPLPEKP